jgi:tripartite-type tricarboxylate transporter receptor subunit TctC
MQLFRWICAALAILAAAPGWTQPASPGPIKVLNGFAAGGQPDRVLRKVAERLALQLGTPVIVENRPGASGTIAGATVARAAPDGRTLLFGVAANLAVAPATMAAPPYDATQAFTPIIEVARGPYLLLVRADAPARDVAGLLAWVRSNPGKLNYATPGKGSVHHLGMEMLRLGQRLDMVHVPYRGGLYQALLAGEVHVMLESLPGPLPHLEAGTLRALAVTGPKRLALLPNIPTLAEAGIQDVDVSSWWGFVGPPGMPRPLVESLNAEIRRALADPEILATMAQWGIELTPGTPEAFGRHIAAENQRWKSVVTRVGLALE